MKSPTRRFQSLLRSPRRHPGAAAAAAVPQPPIEIPPPSATAPVGQSEAERQDSGGGPSEKVAVQEELSNAAPKTAKIALLSRIFSKQPAGKFLKKFIYLFFV
jgi:hypothetical protein